MIEFSHTSESNPQTIVLEDGTLEPAMNVEKERSGFKNKYVVRVPVTERGFESFKESTYYLKPDSEGSKTGAVERYVRSWDVKGDIYGMRPQVEVLPEDTRYQLEERVNSNNTKTTVLTLTLPHRIPE